MRSFVERVQIRSQAIRREMVDAPKGATSKGSRLVVVAPDRRVRRKRRQIGKAEALP